MRKFLLALTTAGAVCPIPAHAQSPDAAAQPIATPPPTTTPTFDPSIGVTVVSDYRFRGLSQSDKRPAIQGTVSVSHASGFYVGTWASTISNYVAYGSDAEIDLYGGFKKTTAGGTTVDVGLLYYLYPDSEGATTNFFEPYANVTHAFGAVTAKVGTNFAWKQKALSVGNGNKGALYLYGELGGTIPRTPVSVTGHFGRSFTRDYITAGTHYNDWSLTAAYTLSKATLSIGYVDTNKSLFSYPAGGGRNRNISKGGLVASLGFAF